MPPPEHVSMTSLAIHLERVSTQLDGHLRECAAANIIAADALRRVADKMDKFEKLPSRALMWFVGVVGAAAITILTQNFVLHGETAAKAAQAASEASQTAQSQTVINHKLDVITAQTNSAAP